MKKIYLGSLTALAIMASTLAQAQEIAYAPELEGGLTASVGTFYVTPSLPQKAYTSLHEEGIDSPVTDKYVVPGYDFGIDASIGYVFANTANSIELFFRNINTSDSASAAGFSANNTEFIDYVDSNVGLELNSFDLMISQFLDLGQHMQLRFMAGLAYLELESNQTTNTIATLADGTPNPFGDSSDTDHEEFRGWGPRLGIDSRYDFGDEDWANSFGIVAGGSVAYFLGDIDGTLTEIDFDGTSITENNMDVQSVINFRGNIGIDYVYFFENEEQSTLGLEVGYLVDYYNENDANVTFSGPYVNLKGVF